MTPLLISFLCLTMVATAFLSGVFGMAGRLILIGVLLAVLPLPAAMALHAVTQMASNGWRALLWWRHVRWRLAAVYILGCCAALLVWSIWRYVPDKPVALLLLGATPFMARLLPGGLKPNAESPVQGVVYGAICMSLLLLTGVAGPLIDSYFLGGKLARREIVATKAACQVFGHGVKLIYFGSIIDQAASVDPTLALLAIAASMVGTTLSKRVLEALTEGQYRTWAQRIITTVAGYYLLYGGYLLLVS
jgi:uncharacterized membrane protein YfcA